TKAARNGGQLGTESALKGEQGTVQVKFRNRRTVVEHRDIVGKRREDGNERRVDDHEHAGSAARDERNVAHELNRVAEALFQIKHDGLAGEWLPPGPLRA